MAKLKQKSNITTNEIDKVSYLLTNLTTKTEYGEYVCEVDGLKSKSYLRLKYLLCKYI